VKIIPFHFCFLAELRFLSFPEDSVKKRCWELDLVILAIRLKNNSEVLQEKLKKMSWH